ncbi:MAG TPA: hypothetical protein PLM33_08150, partial [Acidobacteriota bacterium]|nr:hypothetical protein [Acidobacteriota bacterium]
MPYRRIPVSTSLTSDLAEEIRSLVRRVYPEMLEYLELLVRAESPTSDPVAAAEVFRLLEVPLRELGFETRRMPGKTSAGVLTAFPRSR